MDGDVVPGETGSDQEVLEHYVAEMDRAFERMTRNHARTEAARARTDAHLRELREILSELSRNRDAQAGH